MDLLTFTPYLGDTFLANAIANRIHAETGRKPAIAALNLEMARIIEKDWGGKAVLSHTISEFIREGSLWNEHAQVIKKRENGQWRYYYNPSIDYDNKIFNLCYEILKNFKGETVYTLHNTYPHALLGKVARELGFKVKGYFLVREDEFSFDELVVQDGDKIVPAPLWTPEYIGDRLSRLATGKSLWFNDFTCKHRPSKRQPKMVTLFPYTRSATMNAGNWEMDAIRLRELGYDVRVAIHHSEKWPSIPKTTLTIFSNVKEMVDLITSSDFIICNDSIAFHLAWYYGKFAIVKMKSGFNQEWFPKWLNRLDNIYVIRPSKYFEEEYLHILDEALEHLGVR